MKTLISIVHTDIFLYFSSYGINMIRLGLNRSTLLLQAAISCITIMLLWLRRNVIRHTSLLWIFPRTNQRGWLFMNTEFYLICCTRVHFNSRLLSALLLWLSFSEVSRETLDRTNYKLPCLIHSPVFPRLILYASPLNWLRLYWFITLINLSHTGIMSRCSLSYLQTCSLSSMYDTLYHTTHIIITTRRVWS